MSLTDALQLRTPLVWVNSEEPGRVLDQVLAHETERKVYRLDAIKGLMEWDAEHKRWLQVLVDDPMMESGVSPVQGLPGALPYVFSNGGVFIIEHAHTIVESLFGFFTSVSLQFRQAFVDDDLDALPAQFLLVSHKPAAPAELLKFVSMVTLELPDEDELARLTTLLYRTRELSDETATSIVRAGKGMSESEFVTAGLISLRDNDAIDPVEINRIKVDALKKDGVLEVTTPDVGLDDLGGLDNLKELVQRIAWTWHEPEAAAEYGVEPMRRMLLVGVPGTGKSLAAKAIAAMLGLDLAKGGVSNAMSKWVGESEQNMRRMFQVLKAMMPITFWIDEFGRDMSGSGSQGDSGTTDRVHGEFLTGVQELPNQIFLVGAANRIDQLPPEMLRSGRFDAVMFVGFPTIEERMEIFNIHLGKNRAEYDVAALAQTTPFFTGAEIEALIKSTRFKIGAGQQRHVNTADLLAEIPNVRGRVWINHRPAIIDMYTRAQSEWEWASSAQQAESERVLSVARPSAPPVQSGPKVTSF